MTFKELTGVLTCVCCISAQASVVGSKNNTFVTLKITLQRVETELQSQLKFPTSHLTHILKTMHVKMSCFQKLSLENTQ